MPDPTIRAVQDALLDQVSRVGSTTVTARAVLDRVQGLSALDGVSPVAWLALHAVDAGTALPSWGQAHPAHARGVLRQLALGDPRRSTWTWAERCAVTAAVRLLDTTAQSKPQNAHRCRPPALAQDPLPAVAAADLATFHREVDAWPQDLRRRMAACLLSSLLPPLLAERLGEQEGPDPMEALLPSAIGWAFEGTQARIDPRLLSHLVLLTGLSNLPIAGLWSAWPSTPTDYLRGLEMWRLAWVCDAASAVNVGQGWLQAMEHAAGQRPGFLGPMAPEQWERLVTTIEPWPQAHGMLDQHLISPPWREYALHLKLGAPSSARGPRL